MITDGRGTILRVSPSTRAILGYDPKDMVGRSGGHFVYPDDLGAVREEMRTARRGRLMRNFETRHVHKDGRVVALARSGVWSESEQRHFFIGRDMTEQRLAEEKFRLAVEASPSGLVMIDADGIIVLINAETERLFGYERPELIGRSVDILVPEVARGRHSQHRAAFVAGPQTRRMGSGRDLFAVRKDGFEEPYR
jgi:PAS domain S-box-containing protein